MKIITEASGPVSPAAVVSIGMFDGVHRGHRRVLQRLREIGQNHGVPTVLVTFDPHPRAVLRPDSAPPLLSSLADRMELLSATSALDYCLVLPFDRSRGEQTADDFVKDTLVRRLGIRALVVGENFMCGRRRQGDVSHLRALGAKLGFAVHPVPLRTSFDTSLNHCSSSETRRLIQIGDVTSAAVLLERPHELTGVITRSAQTISDPIDVVLPDGMCTPAADHYAGAVRKKGTAAPWTPAILQVGEDRVAKGRSVRLVTAEGLAVSFGELMTLRFLGRASDSRGGRTADPALSSPDLCNGAIVAHAAS
ncbi:Riboflavin kinase / FMN adenylyltransferase [Caballeronia glathei]|uniref:Bifunctional riboflavin kinase/FMN adenylyltransferase n=1 Tax=Caballeronia glathei TaxID=60547 RepID=A0A069PQM9_9BURK|nr:FAD synthetase family protein [Caballeronia glathei]KDR42727.1 FMN adenylyltransferase [Caballeronia glathei]CDY79059.1 Riboflavin kinase / FMN adenylyltransferase [Caballeronia glathei]